MKLKLEEKFRLEHENKLTEIYKRLFGFYRINDKEAKEEIEVEARQLSKDLSDELVRVIGQIYDESVNNNTTS